jgi:hypothetical protein
MSTEAELIAGEVKLSLDQPVTIPLSQFVRSIAKEAALVVLEEHRSNCPIKDVEAKVDRLEVRFGTLVGMMIGSGTLGGAVVAGLARLMG